MMTSENTHDLWQLFFVCALAATMGCSSSRSDNPKYLEIEAFPFGPSEDIRDDFYYAVNGLDTDGDHIFVTTGMTGLLELDQDGNKVQVYGEPGKGPAFLSKVVGSAVSPHLVWILDGRARLHCCERGTGSHLYSSSLEFSKGEFHTIFTRSTASNSLLFVDNHLLLPIYTEGGRNTIALIVDQLGQVTKQIKDPDYHEIHEKDVPGWRRTIWVHDGGFWYYAYMYRHRILTFDGDFEKVYDKGIKNSATDRYDDWVNSGSVSTPFYWDMDQSGSSLYLLARDGVDQVDKDTGAFIRKIVFRYLQINCSMVNRSIGQSLFLLLGSRKEGWSYFCPTSQKNCKTISFRQTFMTN